ncbi:hypothetical protein CK203_074638 [Vitis vinifera]|uniref:Retrovirus-related Pol polyprotein from transposon TNT 1-94 n=1 Tax=Vitis vinifera TaxID=29760 RepID=A0A438DWM6_VITVI|nr:hypothetical protein CK203_074638 [Vitis vinifera]
MVKPKSIVQRKEGENHLMPLKVYSRRMQPVLESLHAPTIDHDKEIPRIAQEALRDENWKKSMMEEMSALKKDDTWEVVNLPKGKRKAKFYRELSRGFKEDFIRNKACRLSKRPDMVLNNCLRPSLNDLLKE